MQTEEFEKHIENLNLKIPKGITYNEQTVVFKPYKPFGISKDYPYIPIFKKPIEICHLEDKGVYRVIARYPNLAISNGGRLISLDNSKLKIKHNTKYIYAFVNVSPTKDGYVSATTLHKLVALAWVENDDYVKNNIVDHIDGNKTNNHVDNLRWVSNSRNVAKTANGVDFRWLVKNMRTGVVSRFTSFTKVGSFLDMDKTMFSAERCPFIIKKNTGAYIVEDSTNFKGWLLENKYDIYGNKFKYIFNGIKYTNIFDIAKAFKANLKNVNEVRNYANRHGYKFTVIDSKKCSNVYAKDITTGEELKFNSNKDVASYFNVSEAAVRFRVTGYRNGRPLINKWLLRKCGMAYPSLKEEHKSMPKKIVIDNGDEKKEFTSLRQVGLYFNKDKATIKKYMLSNSTLNGYKVSLVRES